MASSGVGFVTISDRILEVWYSMVHYTDRVYILHYACVCRVYRVVVRELRHTGQALFRQTFSSIRYYCIRRTLGELEVLLPALFQLMCTEIYECCVFGVCSFCCVCSDLALSFAVSDTQCWSSWVFFLQYVANTKVLFS